MKNIVLCGFMGSGKSKIGVALATKLNMKFVDTDEVIQEQENLKISEIFKNFGEEYFRNLETKLIEKLSDEEGMVIALGGGLAANPKNHVFLKKCGKIVLLDCGIEETLKRISGDKTRPLTAGGAEDIIKRYNERRPVYKSIAHIVIDSSGEVNETLNALISKISGGKHEKNYS